MKPLVIIATAAATVLVTSAVLALAAHRPPRVAPRPALLEGLLAMTAPVLDRTPSARALKASHRCDRCGAQAYVAAEIAGVDLLFCAHHFGRFEATIRAQAVELVDDRWVLAAAEAGR